MEDDVESFGGYFPFECWGRMEHLGIFCITVDRAAYMVAKHGEWEGWWPFDISHADAYARWIELLLQGVTTGTLKTAVKKFDLGEKINIYHTAVDLFDLKQWLEDRDVHFDDDRLEELIGERTALLEKADAFVKTEAIAGGKVESLTREEALAERLEAALSENRRLQKVLSDSVAESDVDAKTDRVGSKKSDSASLNIIGALCDLYWTTVHPENKKLNQSEIISALSKYSDYAGLSERNLKDKLSNGIKAIRLEK